MVLFAEGVVVIIEDVEVVDVVEVVVVLELLSLEWVDVDVV